MESQTKSNLTLINRQQLELTGIKKIRSSEPSLIIAQLDNGSIVISGTNLSVEHLDLKEGLLNINGTVNQIKYTNQVSKNFSIKNMFK